MELFAQQLTGLFGERLKEQELLSKHLNFRLGGPAKCFVEVKTKEELVQAIDIATNHEVDVFVLGGGSNTLVSDEGLNGLVIKLGLRGHSINGTTVEAEAGMISAALARLTANAGLKGFTWAISLPGTIGGAVRGNAGCFGGEMKDSVVSVDVLRDGKVVTLTNEQMQFGYRDSLIKHTTDVVLSAKLELAQGDPEALKQELADTLSARKSTQPLYAGSAGCLFKNYAVLSDEELQRLSGLLDIPVKMSEQKRLSSGWIIDQLGLKGTKIGGAQISNEHGNFVINADGATASDVNALIDFVKAEVKKRLAIELEEEVQLIGFIHSS